MCGPNPSLLKEKLGTGHSPLIVRHYILGGICGWSVSQAILLI
jgi:hypothetical protein